MNLGLGIEVEEDVEFLFGFAVVFESGMFCLMNWEFGS